MYENMNSANNFIFYCYNYFWKCLFVLVARNSADKSFILVIDFVHESV